MENDYQNYEKKILMYLQTWSDTKQAELWREIKLRIKFKLKLIYLSTY